MGVASSRFHWPYVHFTYIDMRGALTLAHKNFVWWEMRKYSVLALVCHAHLITRMNARLLFEDGSYFFELAKSAATIRGRLLFGVRLQFK